MIYLCEIFFNEIGKLDVLERLERVDVLEILDGIEST